MNKRLLLSALLTLVFAMSLSAASHRFTLVIDAGHGGHDAGAVGAFSKEKNINLKVALAFGRLVEQNFPDVRVVYTRKTDVFVTLNERANIANRAKADLFVSVHTNALPKGRIARGFEVYTLGMHRASENLDVAKRENSVILVEKDYKQRYQGFDPNSSESYIMFEFIQDKNMSKSVELARMIQREVCAGANRPDKGVHQAGFLVLRATSMPSCLVELGFITTADEEQLLNSESGINGHAQGLYRAFANYKGKYDGNIVVPYSAPKKSEQTVIPSIVPKEEKAQQPQKETTKPIAKQAEQPENSKNQTSEEAPKTVEKADAKMVGIAALPETPKDVPVFKVQILASSKQLSKNDSQLKGCTDADCYQENGMYKYTMGGSADYNEVNRLRKSLAEKFPSAFVIAFKNGEKMDVRAAIQEFLKNKK